MSKISQISTLRWIYLILAVVGAVLPMSYFMSWFLLHGFSLSAMIDAWHVNDASSGLVWDLTIAALALTVWICAEVSVRKDYWVGLVSILATFSIGLSCGLPLYLFLRTIPRD